MFFSALKRKVITFFLLHFVYLLFIDESLGKKNLFSIQISALNENQNVTQFLLIFVSV